MVARINLVFFPNHSERFFNLILTKSIALRTGWHFRNTDIAHDRVIAVRALHVIHGNRNPFYVTNKIVL